MYHLFTIVNSSYSKLVVIEQALWHAEAMLSCQHLCLNKLTHCIFSNLAIAFQNHLKIQITKVRFKWFKPFMKKANKFVFTDLQLNIFSN